VLLSEIVDNEPLLLTLLKQREDKGDSIFLYDSQYMHYEEKIVCHWKDSDTSYIFRVINNGDLREIIYSFEDLENADLQKRSANTWSVVIKNEAD
jgi:hypothetical protein